MAVPTSGNFKMFGTGSNTTIAGALNASGEDVTDLTTFTQLVGVSIAGKYKYEFAGAISNPPTEITSSLQFKGYPVDPGTCRVIWVDDTVNQSRYGLRYVLPSGQEIDVLFGNLFGTPYSFGGSSGTVYNVCSLLTPSTWDSNTNTLVDLGGLVVNFANGGSCYINTDCEWIPPTATPTPTPSATPTATPTPTPLPATATPTPSPTPIRYYYQLTLCDGNPAVSIYGYSLTPRSAGYTVTYNSNIYTYYDVDPTQQGTIELDTLTETNCPTATPTPTPLPPTATPTATPTPLPPTATPTPTPIRYYYHLTLCDGNPAVSMYGYSLTERTAGYTVLYNSNIYTYYDVDPAQQGTIELDTLTETNCPTATPTPAPSATPTPTPSPTPLPSPISLGYALTFNEACDDYVSAPSNYYTDTDNWASATIIYTDAAKTTKATAGYYSDGETVKYFDGNSVTTSFDCGYYGSTPYPPGTQFGTHTLSVPATVQTGTAVWTGSGNIQNAINYIKYFTGVGTVDSNTFYTVNTSGGNVYLGSTPYTQEGTMFFNPSTTQMKYLYDGSQVTVTITEVAGNQAFASTDNLFYESF